MWSVHCSSAFDQAVRMVQNAPFLHSPARTAGNCLPSLQVSPSTAPVSLAGRKVRERPGQSLGLQWIVCARTDLTELV